MWPVLPTLILVAVLGTIMDVDPPKLNNKQRKVLEKIADKPTAGSIEWSDIEKLFVALGAEVEEGRGSRVEITFRDRTHHFHRPHPGKEAKKYVVDDVRRILQEEGIIDA